MRRKTSVAESAEFPYQYIHIQSPSTFTVIPTKQPTFSSQILVFYRGKRICKREEDRNIENKRLTTEKEVDVQKIKAELDVKLAAFMIQSLKVILSYEITKNITSSIQPVRIAESILCRMSTIFLPPPPPKKKNCSSISFLTLCKGMELRPCSRKESLQNPVLNEAKCNNYNMDIIRQVSCCFQLGELQLQLNV